MVSPLARSEARTISVFPTASDDGRALAIELSQRLGQNADVKVEVFDRDMHALSDSSVLTAAMTADLVIFDATRENNTSNFDLAVEPLPLLPSVQLVSRNYLPENFSSLRDKYCPTYIEGTKKNAEIVEAVVSDLGSLLEMRGGMAKAMKSFAGRIEIRPSDLAKARVDSPSAFISHRTQYNAPGRRLPYKKAVADLAKTLNSRSPASRLSAFYFPDGALVYRDELLTEQRRWYLLELILRRIRAAQEFWIYGAVDHFQSWWTTAELAAFIYSVNFLGEAKRLRVYDPIHDEVLDISCAQWPELDPLEYAHLGNRLSLLNMAEGRHRRAPLAVGAFVGALGRHWPTKPLVWCALAAFYRATRWYERAGSIDVLGPFSFADFHKVMTSAYYWDQVRGRLSKPEFWKQLQVISAGDATRRPVERESGGKRLVFPVEWGRLFALDGLENVLVDEEDLERGEVQWNGRVYELRREKPRFMFDRQSEPKRLRAVDVVRMVPRDS